jgi:hypothetical protein
LTLTSVCDAKNAPPPKPAQLKPSSELTLTKQPSLKSGYAVDAGIACQNVPQEQSPLNLTSQSGIEVWVNGFSVPLFSLRCFISCDLQFEFGSKLYGKVGEDSLHFRSVPRIPRHFMSGNAS